MIEVVWTYCVFFLSLPKRRLIILAVDRAMQRVQNLLDQAGKLKDLGKELCAAQTKEQVGWSMRKKIRCSTVMGR